MLGLWGVVSAEANDTHRKVKLARRMRAIIWEWEKWLAGTCFRVDSAVSAGDALTRDAPKEELLLTERIRRQILPTAIAVGTNS